MKKTIGFSFSITSIFSGIIFAFAMLLIGYNYTESSKNSYEMAKDINQKITENIKEKVTSLLRSPRESLQVISNNDNNTIDIQKLMWEILLTKDNYASIFYGDQNRSFLQVRREPEFALRSIDNGVDTWFFTDTKKTTSKEATYNPTIRGWYKSAHQENNFYLSDPYIFSSTGKPGITISSARFENGEKRGVYAIDITLEDLIKFVKRQTKITKGEIVIFTKDGDIVADSTIDKISEISKIKKRDNLIIQTILQTKDSSSVEVLGDNYIFNLSTFKTGYNEEWKILTFTKEDVILGSLKELIHNSIYISLFLLVLTIMAVIMIAKKVSKPIIKISDISNSLKSMDLSVEIESNSKIAEIKRAQESLVALKAGLGSFKRYMPADLVNLLIKTGQEAKVGGSEKELAIMFTDIENFTTISESLSPEELTTQLSEYLEYVAHIIGENEGTIDKYIGDAVLAFWGAPVDVEDPTIKAVKTALEVQEKLDEINREWAKQGKTAFNTRIGIHFGKTLVGNVGSNERLNYTIIGDSVNLTARLESINKFYGTRVMISEHTYQIVKDDFYCRVIDVVAVKGKKEGVKIYEVISQNGNTPNEKLVLTELYEEAFNDYLAQNFEESEKKFRDILQEFPEDKASQIFLERVEELQKDSTIVNKDWNGVYVMTSK